MVHICYNICCIFCSCRDLSPFPVSAVQSLYTCICFSISVSFPTCLQLSCSSTACYNCWLLLGPSDLLANYSNRSSDSFCFNNSLYCFLLCVYSLQTWNELVSNRKMPLANCSICEKAKKDLTTPIFSSTVQRSRLYHPQAVRGAGHLPPLSLPA
jgi:hypothetical protein